MPGYHESMTIHNFPIIHIIGLPGAGKTTLGKRLSKELGLPIYRIGEYRAKFPMSITGEADAWVALFHDLLKRKWQNCILETTGLNKRESFLRTALPPDRMIAIKLESPKNVLYARIRNKRKNEQGGKWLFSDNYQDKFEFVRKLFKQFKMIPAEIEIDSSKYRAEEVYKTAVQKLRSYVYTLDS